MGTRGSENKVYSLRLPMWMANAIDKIAKEQRCTSTDIVVELLRQELEVMGYSMGIGRQAVKPLEDKKIVKPASTSGLLKTGTG